MSERVLVTGGSGYFGSLLVQRLLDRGCSCRIFDQVDATDRPTGVEFIHGDIRDLGALERACAGVSVVHHNVAQVPLARSRHLFDSVNITGTANLLQAARTAQVRKVVYTSSSAIYGAPRGNPVTEETPPQPAEAYGRAKLRGEDLCREATRTGLDVTVIRPRTILGHGRLGIFQILFEWIRTGFNVPVFGRGDNRYQFIHADDLADACIRAGERPGPGLYNIGAERFGTMREVLESLCKHAGTGSRVRGVPMAPTILAMRLAGWLGLSPLGPYHALMYGRSLYFDISRAKRELNWQPAHSNEEMMIQSYDWYLANRETVQAHGGLSHHRSGVKQGVLNLLRWCL